MTCPVCNRTKRVCWEDGCINEPSLLLDEYPATQYFSTRKVKTGDVRCKCGWYHSDGYACPKPGEHAPDLKPEYHSLHEELTSDQYIKDMEKRVNRILKVYDETPRKSFTQIEPLDIQATTKKTRIYRSKINELIGVVNELMQKMQHKEQGK